MAKDAIRIGVTGHQARPGLVWGWTAHALRTELASETRRLEGWSSLAIGADQLFARTVLALGGTLVTVVPGPWYESCFDAQGLACYHALLARSERVDLTGGQEGAAFLAAGMIVAGRSDRLIAIWDGAAAQGKGGTADIVAHALAIGRPVVRLDPIRCERSVLGN